MNREFGCKKHNYTSYEEVFAKKMEYIQRIWNSIDSLGETEKCKDFRKTVFRKDRLYLHEWLKHCRLIEDELLISDLQLSGSTPI